MKNVAVSAVSTVDSNLEDTINDSLFKLGVAWAFSMGYLPILALGLKYIFS